MDSRYRQTIKSRNRSRKCSRYMIVRVFLILFVTRIGKKNNTFVKFNIDLILY